MKSPLRAGVGRRNISPELGTPLMGYANPERVAKTIRDPLNVTTLALEQDGRRALVMTFDLGIPENRTVAEIRAAVTAKTNIAPADIMICFSQTHSGPNTQDCWGWCERDMKYLSAMYPKAAESAAEALAGLTPVRIGIGVTSSDVAINRRALREDHNIGLGTCPWAPHDPEMTVLRFERETGDGASGGTLATLIHYGAHPTVFDSSTRAASRDWPGVMIDRVEHFSKAPALFVNGAVGDIAPRTNTMGAVGDGEAALQETGGRAAMDAMRAWRSIKEFRRLDLYVLTRPMKLPYRPLPGLDEAKKKVAEFEPRKNEFGVGMCEHRHWSEVVKAHAGKPLDAAVYEQTITSIGPVSLVPFPGEPFAETVLRLKLASPVQHTLCASTSNGSYGYFVTRDSLHRGGYEVWVAKAFSAYTLAENIDDVLFEENLKLLREVHRAGL